MAVYPQAAKSDTDLARVSPDPSSSPTVAIVCVSQKDMYFHIRECVSQLGQPNAVGVSLPTPVSSIPEDTLYSLPRKLRRISVPCALHTHTPTLEIYTAVENTFDDELPTPVFACSFSSSPSRFLVPAAGCEHACGSAAGAQGISSPHCPPWGEGLGAGAEGASGAMGCRMREQLVPTMSFSLSSRKVNNGRSGC